LSGLEEAFRELVEDYYTDRTGSDRTDQAFAISALTVCPLFRKFSLLLREHTPFVVASVSRRRYLNNHRKKKFDTRELRL
jgi:hypothetical protein